MMFHILIWIEQNTLSFKNVNIDLDLTVVFGPKKYQFGVQTEAQLRTFRNINTIKFKQSWSSRSTLICRISTLLFDLKFKSIFVELN